MHFEQLGPDKSWPEKVKKKKELRLAAHKVCVNER